MSLLTFSEAGASTALRSFDAPSWLWIAFLAGVVGLLLLDLLVLHRSPHTIMLREAAIASAGWVLLGVGFAVVVWRVLGSTAATQYLTAYVVEKSLSVDNVFVWAVTFGSFGVAPIYHHRMLFWGIFGALAMRGIFIFAGVALLARLEWVLYLFGGFLLVAAFRVTKPGDHEFDPRRSRTLAVLRRIIPMTDTGDGHRLFTRRDGRLLATPLFAVLVVIESADLLFAVDSVPAVLAISRDPFVVFASNALAILGLRSLYFLIGGVRRHLVHLDRGLAAILAFVGLKMMAVRWYHLPAWLSLGVIAVILVVTVVASRRAGARPITREHASGRAP